MRQTITPPALREFNNAAEIRPYLARIDVWRLLFLLQAGEIRADAVGRKLGLTANAVNWLHQEAGERVKHLVEKW